MKITKWSEIVDQFAKENADLPRVEGGVIILCAETLSGPLRIFIDVGEDTTSEQLRNAIPLALKWRDRLLKFQGRYGLYTDNSLLKNFEEDQRTNRYTNRGEFSYAEIAEALNYKIAGFLYEFTGRDQPASDPPRYVKTLEFHISGIEERIPDPIERARRLLQVIRFTEEDTSFFIQDGIEQIQNGKKPFRKGYPVSKEKIRSVLKWWRDKGGG